MTAARVIVCTGAGTNIAGTRDPLLRALLAGGYAAPDPLGLGLRTSPSGAVLDRRGRVSEVLSTLGALRRGELWESTAAAEIRTQARDVAAELCRSLGVAGTWQEAGAT
ncbi:MAG: hypothetical protein ACXW08_01390 [Solirubrobacteraceae bacterium]